jgi:hypothetical protein
VKVAVLPLSSGFDVSGLGARPGEPLAQIPCNELSPVIRAQMLGHPFTTITSAGASISSAASSNLIVRAETFLKTAPIELVCMNYLSAVSYHTKRTLEDYR